MSNASSRAAFRKSAIHSRRAGMRSRPARCVPPPPWSRPLRRARRALASSIELIEGSRRLVETSEESGALRPVHATRGLQRAAGWLCDAAARLSTGFQTLREAAETIAVAPEHAADLPHHITEWTFQYLGLMRRIVETSDRLDASFAQIHQSAIDGTMLPDPSLYRRPAVAAARVPFGRPLAPKWPSCDHVPVITIHVRRRRSAPRTIAEPSKRVSRGRAPPCLSSASVPTPETD
jgi:hypothetical protein